VIQDKQRKIFFDKNNRWLEV